MLLRKRLLSTTLVPVVVGMGIGLVVVGSEARSASNSVFLVAAACNPCAAANPCNPCAAANPCAASACNPCAPLVLTSAETEAAYDGAKGGMQAGYAKSKLMSDTGMAIAEQYQGWARYNTQPYVSDTHGGRFVNHYGNRRAKAYGKFENAGVMPTGAVLAKDSFVVRQGKVVPGPLFVMEKMPAGFNAGSGNWRYTMVMPGGKLFGSTNGKGSGNVEFCIGCHMTAEDTDSLWLLPEEYRAK